MPQTKCIPCYSSISNLYSVVCQPIAGLADKNRSPGDKYRFKNQIPRFLNKTNLFLVVYKSRQPFIDKAFAFIYI
ncbi:hypothetical protein ALGA_3868 [Labilibaculum antarcticum]|uniref:Uncharacterized protein n=1 Tax=Labilibaculum antarcticum TaxID=1717717 RepID=A0A1Y1CPG3_9BACT|nr:hypothetical protein ALGA_3868 [Labilibaculum antarcticum]